MNLRDQLLAIRDRHGVLTPGLVLDEARDEQHPLHTRFEWDDTAAAEKWRLEQAHQLIVSVDVAYVDGRGRQQSVRAFHAIRTPSGYAYQPAEEVAADPLALKMLLADMERDWKTLKARYSHMAEFAAMVRSDVSEQAA